TTFAARFAPGQGIVSDEIGRSADLVHHVVAGIDTERTADAGKLLAVADIDPGRTHANAEAAIDAVPLPWRSLTGLRVRTRLAPPFFIRHQQRMLVEHGRLEPRPRAPIDANLLARPAGQNIGRGSEEADETIDGEACIAGDKLAKNCRRVIEIKDPRAA